MQIYSKKHRRLASAASALMIGVLFTGAMPNALAANVKIILQHRGGLDGDRKILIFSNKLYKEQRWISRKY